MKRIVIFIALASLWVVGSRFASDAFQTAPGDGDAAQCVSCHPRIFQVQGHVIESASAQRLTPPLGGTTLNSLDCLTCHVSHSEVQPKQLRPDRQTATPTNSSITFDPATRVCLSCHPLAGEFQGWGRGYVRHPIGIPVKKPGVNLNDSAFPPLVDVKGTPDRSDDVIGCTTCHKFHESANSFLLRWRNRTELAAACLKCHPEVVPAARSPLAQAHGLSLVKWYQGQWESIPRAR